MTSIALESVSKRFGDTTVLDGISIEFPSLATTALVGPSGCGKSTLLKLCNALERPTAGRVLLFGKPLNYDHMVSLRRRLGYAVQGNGLFPHLTARENIVLLGSLERWPNADIDQRLQELLALCHLPKDLIDRYPHQLSGGQQQRVGLCRAMMLRPEVLLLDEPFAAIDPITRLDIHEQLLELQRAEPRTTLLVTHDMREALRLSDHLVVLGGGKVLLESPSAEVAASLGNGDPDRFLADLLAEQPS